MNRQLLDVNKSVLWAFLGVQKSKNHERDFKYGKPSQYIIIGLVGGCYFYYCFSPACSVRFIISRG